jgi:hypothetical protein
MTLTQTVLAEGTQITLPPSRWVVFWLIALAAIAFARRRTFLATAVLVAALLLAGAASVYNQATQTLSSDQRLSSTHTPQVEHEGVNIRTPSRPDGTSGP